LWVSTMCAQILGFSMVSAMFYSVSLVLGLGLGSVYCTFGLSIHSRWERHPVYNLTPTAMLPEVFFRNMWRKKIKGRRGERRG